MAKKSVEEMIEELDRECDVSIRYYIKWECLSVGVVVGADSFRGAIEKAYKIYKKKKEGIK